jgi:hypothetical protein
MKRGRKPKGGKIMDSSQSELVMTVLENIILHLKCSSKDISEIRYNHTIVDPFIEEECQEPLKTYAEDNLHQKIKKTKIEKCKVRLAFELKDCFQRHAE